VQQHISSLNDILLNLVNPMGRNALMQVGEEIAHYLRVEIQNTKELLLTTSQNADKLRDIIKRTSEMNYQLFLSRLPPVQGNNAHGHGLTNELESTGSGNQAMNIRGTAPENTRRSIICRLCYSRGACMLMLPCRHICACKSCEVILTHCPICVSPKASAAAVKFV
jgi:E3 ubiquitin-protein ligase BOI-like protein